MFYVIPMEILFQTSMTLMMMAMAFLMMMTGVHFRPAIQQLIQLVAPIRMAMGGRILPTNFLLIQANGRTVMAMGMEIISVGQDLIIVLVFSEIQIWTVMVV